MADVTRNLGPSTSQSSYGEAIGHAEDYDRIIKNIDPNMTLFLNLFGKLENATQLRFLWTTEGLRPPQVNAQLEKFDYTFEKVNGIRHLQNYQQHMYKSGYITDAQIKAGKIYTPDELPRQKFNVSQQLARDIEFALAKNDVAREENGSTPAMTGGVRYFMNTEKQACTIATTGIVTTIKSLTDTTGVNHGLSTGDFVFFVAGTMPDEIKEDLVYYIGEIDNAPTTFQLYNTMEGAIKGVAADKVTLTNAVTTSNAMYIVKNNVRDLGGSADFTLDDLNIVLEMASKRGGSPTEAFMSSSKMRRFNSLVSALATTNRKSGDKKMDMVTTTYISTSGVINARVHPMYDDNYIDIIDPQYWHRKDFDPVHPVQKLAKTGTYETFALEGWIGLQADQPLASASLIGIKR